MIDSEGFPKPFIRSGPYKGQIRDKNVAHEAYNALEETSRRQKVGDNKKVDFFQKYANEDVGDPLIIQAAKTVREEEKNTFDDLTKLHQKKSFQLFIEDDLNSLKSGELKSLGILRFDLDNFSWLNDNLEAHLIGDLYLATVGKIIRDEIKGKEDIGIRISGDEFAALLHNIPDPESFKSAAQRLHISLNTGTLTMTLQSILHANKSISNEDGKQDREGTVILKQFLSGFRNLRKDVDGRAKHFMRHGRGSRKDKRNFLDLLENINLEHYEIYSNDKRTWQELSLENQKDRMIQESEVVELFERVFNGLGVSTGGIFVTGYQTDGFPAFSKRTDELVYAVKRRGGRGYNLEHDIRGKKI